MRPGIEHVELRNWRGLPHFAHDLPLDGVLWLVGRNGAGKSSLLDGLAFVADLVREGADARRARLRGRADQAGLVPFFDLLRDPETPAVWTIVLRDVDGARWRYHLQLAPQADGFTVVHEHLERETQGRWAGVLEVGNGAARWLVAGAPASSWEPVEPPLGRPLLADARPGLHDAGAAAQLLRGTWLLRLDPLLMRDPTAQWSRGGPPERHGRDLISWATTELTADLELVAHLHHVAGALGWAHLELGVRDGRAELQLREADGPARSWQHTSDGELIHLGLGLLTLLLPDQVTVLLLDEPAVAVDRDAAREVAAWVHELGTAVQVVAATQALDAVDEASRDRLLLMRRRPGEGPTYALASEDDRAREVPGLYRPGQVAREVWSTGEGEDG